MRAAHDELDYESHPLIGLFVDAHWPRASLSEACVELRRVLRKRGHEWRGALAYVPGARSRILEHTSCQPSALSSSP